MDGRDRDGILEDDQLKLEYNNLEVITVINKTEMFSKERKSNLNGLKSKAWCLRTKDETEF